MPPPSDHRCSNCAAWQPPATPDGAKGECHRHAPQPALTVEGWGDLLWPEMGARDWCYEWVSPPVVRAAEVGQPAAKGNG